MKAGTCARDRRALQQLALNVHVKHSDLTCITLLLSGRLSTVYEEYEYKYLRDKIGLTGAQINYTTK